MRPGRAPARSAGAHGLPVVEDAACAIGSEILWDGAWQRIGRPHGDVACFSFHPRKVMSTGDGGMLTTDDPALDARFRLLRQHGMSVNDRVRHSANQVIFEEHSVIGFNYRMTDIQAAVGREQLKRLPDIVARRRAIADRYNRAFAERSTASTPPFEPAWARTNCQSYASGSPDGVDQRAVHAGAARTWACRHGAGIMCAHREVPYAGDHHLPQSEWAQDRHIVLPLYPTMDDADIDHVIESVRSSLLTATARCRSLTCPAGPLGARSGNSVRPCAVCTAADLRDERGVGSPLDERRWRSLVPEARTADAPCWPCVDRARSAACAGDDPRAGVVADPISHRPLLRPRPRFPIRRRARRRPVQRARRPRRAHRPRLADDVDPPTADDPASTTAPAATPTGHHGGAV